jgi:LmbE family N-acetylglucosaminyl deacetylase
MTRRLLPCLVALAGAAALAQVRLSYPLVTPHNGHVALGLALRKLSVSGTFMQAPAHPDDETNALFALFGYGMGLRVIDLQNNRGDGGQNEIGPELFHDMAILRTSELLAAHRLDGAEQYFTRAIDYGYSFDPQEVISKWGRKEIVGDYVRLLRTLRPDVVVTMNIQGRGGDRAHEATTVLVHEGYLAAGDPNQYPEQFREGLRTATAAGTGAARCPGREACAREHRSL